MSEAPTEAFGPYLVYEQLGVGGMAQVHRAVIADGAESFQRPIALKRMLPHVAANLDMVKSFVREAHLASFLHHANVAQTYELGKVDDIYFIAMELIRGRNLREILRQCAATTGPMPVPVALNIINQICDALDYAHNLCDESGKPLGIIHRDVSPSNIIVAEGGVAKLIDFGIAKVSSAAMQTMSGTIKGKFGYMAPEYLEGRIDARADLFAVGVIAHELLTNRPLFSTPDDMETLKRVRALDVPPPSHRNPHVPTEVDNIVMTALARDPDQRWQHATALRNAMTTVTQRMGLAVGNAQAMEWIEWVFDQTKPGQPARSTIIIDEDPSIHIEAQSVSVAITSIVPAGTPQRISAQASIPPAAQPSPSIRPSHPSTPQVDPTDPEYAQAVTRYARHDALVPSTGRMSDAVLPTIPRTVTPPRDTPRAHRPSASIQATLAGTAPVPFQIRNPPSASKPPANVEAPVRVTPTSQPAIPRTTTPTGDPPSSPPIRASAPRLRDPAPTHDPPFVHAAKIEIPTTPMPVAAPHKSSAAITVVLVLLAAGAAAAAVYFLLPLVT